MSNSLKFIFLKHADPLARLMIFQTHPHLSVSSVFLYIRAALHWFVSVCFTQQLFPAVFCFVLLNRDLVVSQRGFGRDWRGQGCVYLCVSTLPREGIYHRVYKRIEKD